MRRTGLRHRLIPGLLILAVLATAATAAREPAHVRHPSTTAPAFLVEVARRAATANQEPAPTSARYVLTRRRVAEALAGSEFGDSNQPVYLVVLTGRFVATNADVVSGANPPGTVISFTVDPLTDGVLDFGIGDKPLDLAALGPVRTLPVDTLTEPRPGVCLASDLRVASVADGVLIRNSGANPCVLGSRPGIALQDLSGRSVEVRETKLAAAGPQLYLFQPRARVVVRLQWRNWCGARPHGPLILSLKLRPFDGALALPFAAPGSSCTDRNAPPTLAVGRYESEG